MIVLRAVREKIDAYDAIMMSLTGPNWLLPEHLHLSTLVMFVEYLYEPLVHDSNASTLHPENLYWDIHGTIAVPSTGVSGLALCAIVIIDTRP